MPSHATPPIIVWCTTELSSYGPGLMALAALAVVSGRIRRAINDRRLGEVIPPPHLPPAAAWLCAVLPVGWWLWSLWVSQTQEAFFRRITAEDGWMEYGQVLLLAVGSMTSGWIARSLWKRRQRVWASGYLLLAVALFWAAGEEISWGQRLLHLPTPAWFASRNTQDEMNLHNLAGVDDSLSDVMDQALSWVVFLSAAVWMAGLHRVKRLRVALWLPHPSLIPALCCAISYGEVLYFDQLLHPGAQGSTPAVTQLQEPKELILYFSVAAFLLFVRYLDPDVRAERSDAS